MHGLLKQPGYRLYPPNNPEARDLLAEGLGPADLERAPLDQGPRTARPRAQGQHGAVRPGRYAAGRGPGRRHRLSARKLELIPARLVLCLLAAAASRPGGVLSFCLHSGLSADRQEQLMDQARKRMPQREPDMLLHGAERRTPGPRACHSLCTTLKDRPQRLGLQANASRDGNNGCRCLDPPMGCRGCSSGSPRGTRTEIDRPRVVSLST
jgi:hypothetical protein